MKNKLKIKTILIALMILLVPLASTKAYSSTITMAQNPTTGNVRINDLVVVTVTITPDSDDQPEYILVDEERTSLKWDRNGIEQTPILPNEVLPGRLYKVTFTLGPFPADTQVRYSVDLKFRYAIDYHSSVVTFTVYPEDIPTTTDEETEELPVWLVYTIIGVVALIVLLGIGYVFKKRR